MKGENDMSTFYLRGIAEGVVGKSSVLARSLDDLFNRYPSLSNVKSKIKIQGNCLIGFAACDG